MESETEPRNEKEIATPFAVFPDAQGQTIGSLNVHAAGGDLIHAPTVMSVVTNIAVQYAPQPAHKSESGPQQPSALSVLNFCRTVFNLITCCAGGEDSDSSISVRSLDAGVDLPPANNPSYAEVYVRGLLHSGYGLPCWEPAPHDSDSERTGVMPGDVGTYTVNGSFRKLFNLQDDEKAIRELATVCSRGSYFAMRQHIRRESIIEEGETIVNGVSSDSPPRHGASSSDEVTVAHEFHCHSHPGAVLAVTSSAELVACSDTQSMRNYIVQHAEAIYRHANSIRQIGDSESLYIISASIKTDTWAIAAYRHPMPPQHNILQLVRKPMPTSDCRSQLPVYQWTKQGYSTRARLSRGLGVDQGSKNQSLFLQGFKMALAPRFRARVKASTLTTDSKPPGPTSDEADPSLCLDPPLIRYPACEQTVSGDAEREQSTGASCGDWALDVIGSSRPVNGLDEEANIPQVVEEDAALYTDFPRIPEPGYHPSDYINERVLQVTGAHVSICHDDDWRFLLQSCRSASAQGDLPRASRSLECCSTFPVFPASQSVLKPDSRTIYVRDGTAALRKLLDTWTDMGIGVAYTLSPSDGTNDCVQDRYSRQPSPSFSPKALIPIPVFTI
ncbi:hypothetical protein NMY22_g9684 [Coprinellus aureogranulatus]|nr:hypothetical protein NMY22_g9684 [Coprinellus aureogranulatus]